VVKPPYQYTTLNRAIETYCFNFCQA